jgi:DNA-binding LytR/AlgR family response regulator
MSVETAALSVLAVDDERPALEDLARLLRSSPQIAEVVCARSGDEALRRLAERQFDALFLDVRMSGLGGLELAGVLDRFASPPAVVFVSAYEDGAVRAFEVHAVDFLMKPVSKRRIEDAIDRVAEVTGRSIGRAAPAAGPAAAPAAERAADDGAREEIVAVERANGHATRIVSRASILYVQARGDYVRIVSDEGRYIQRGTLAELERRWSPHGFHRVHRAYLVNLRRAVEMRPDLGGTAVMVLSDGSEVPVARRQVSELLHRLRM